MRPQASRWFVTAAVLWGSLVGVQGEELTLACSKDMARAAVHQAALGLSALLEDLPDEAGRIELVRKYIAPIRFFPDQSGYFYVYDFSCVNMAHATQSDLPGKNLLDHQDAKGKFVIRELSAAAQQGGGFVEFHWVKPGETGEHPKLGYVEPIPGTPWFIGTGVYLPE
ncbi:MAG: cache domain-containing protein [Verrucomicrobia bacterium]|nr:cache domain-containing protein [Verrucomicrobiota bacterium]